MNDLITFSLSTLFVLICLAARRFGPSLVARDGALLSASAGVGVAYLFVDIMPHLAKKQALLLSAADGGLFGFLEHHTYLVALIGFCFFYLPSMLGTRPSEASEFKSSPVPISFVIRVCVLAGSASYLGLVTYMITEQPEHRAEPLFLLASAMAIHVVGLVHFLHDRLSETYDQVDRFVLAAAAWAGWLLGIYIDIPDAFYILWFSLLAGGIFGIVAAELAVISKISRLRYFVVGAAMESGLLIVLERYTSLD